MAIVLYLINNGLFAIFGRGILSISISNRWKLAMEL